METKQIMAIVAVLALAGAACVGAAYAFNASLDNEDNSAAIEYWKLSMKDSSNAQYTGTGANDFKAAFAAATPYDTKTEWVESTTLGTYQESIKMIWSGSTTVIDAKLSPLGYVEVTAKDNKDQPIADLTGTNHYFMTLTMQSKNTDGQGTVNEKYDYYAGIVTPGSGETAHKILEQASELIWFQPTTANGYTTYEAKVPIQTLESGTAVAIYAMPHDMSNLESITSAYLAADADNGKYKTDVLQGAVVTFSVDSRLFESASTAPASADDIAIQNPSTYKYTYDPSLPATADSWDLGNVVVLGKYTDTYNVIEGGTQVEKKIETKRVMAFTTETAYADNVDEIVLKITGTDFTKDLTAQEADP